MLCKFPARIRIKGNEEADKTGKKAIHMSVIQAKGKEHHQTTLHQTSHFEVEIRG